MDAPGDTSTRRLIAAKVKQLRVARGWTQQELAQRLGVAQGHISRLEHGEASFTAEQFLLILKLFNVPAAHFSAQAPEQHHADLQNALARHGATHLREDDRFVPSELLDDVTVATERALVSGEARLVTAVAPVLVRNVDVIHLQRLAANLSRAGLERRLWWAVESTIEAIDDQLPTTASRKQANTLRRARVVLRRYLDAVNDTPHANRTPAPDIIDPIVRTDATVEQLIETSSPCARRWGIVTSIRTRDFALALEAAHVGR